AFREETAIREPRRGGFRAAALPAPADPDPRAVAPCSRRAGGQHPCLSALHLRHPAAAARVRPMNPANVTWAVAQAVVLLALARSLACLWPLSGRGHSGVEGRGCKTAAARPSGSLTWIW